MATTVARGQFVSALDHFRQFGEAEGRDPVPVFDTAFYLAENAEVAAAVQSGETTAYEHYLDYGTSEGRAASAFFDRDEYIAQNRDVAEAGANPFGHLYGDSTGESRVIARMGCGVKVGKLPGIMPGYVHGTQPTGHGQHLAVRHMLVDPEGLHPLVGVPDQPLSCHS